ncbi:MAG TPA: winged helix-turn-helix domain-containing protein [Bryobacteraceae bacterium]|nr:winged helix-turn-helix domain-containing protein [Bryobacteraceae bacterium]
MAFSQSAVRHFRFGPFELNSQTGELRKFGVKLRLPEQSCKVLLALLQQPGELVPRQELQHLLWNANTFVDFEHGLNLAVRRLRQALGDGADEPRYIETLPRRGYRLLGDVHVTAADDSRQSVGSIEQSAAALPQINKEAPRLTGSLLTDAPETGTVSSTPPEGLASSFIAWRRASASFRLLSKWSIAASVILGVMAATAFLIFLDRDARETNPLSATPLTGYVGDEHGPSFSPDGERIAFSWDGQSRTNFDIYVKQIGLPTPLRITSDDRPDISPAWSPDGRMIAFIRLLNSQKADLMVTPALPGGPERRVTELAAPYVLYEDLRLLTWSADSKWLLASEGRTTSSISGLVLVSVLNGEKRPLTLPPPAYDDLDPAFSPDMKWLAFVRHASIQAGDLYVARLKPGLQLSGSPKRLTFDHGPMGSPVWTGSGNELVFARYSTIGRHSLWRIKISNPSSLRPIPVAAEHVTGLSISRQRQRLVYAREVKDSNIWSVELTGERAKRAPLTPKLLIAGNRSELTPSFSGDGRYIGFQSSRSGWNEVWSADRNGSNLCQITDLKGSIAGFPRWSPDGTKILFHSRQQSVAKLSVINLPSLRAEALPYDAFDDYTASWSSDGRTIYFASRRSGEVEVWKVPARGGKAKPVTQNGGCFPLESRDGKWLYYTKPDHPGVWKMSLASGTEQCVAPVSVAAAGSAYAPGHNGIYFIRQAPDHRTGDLAFFDFASHQIKSLAMIGGALELGLALSPDEREVLYSQIDHVESDLMLVENFR